MGTNKNGATTNAREIVGLMDLGEDILFTILLYGDHCPTNNSNSEYSDIIRNPNSRNPALITNLLQNLSPGIKSCPGF